MGGLFGGGSSPPTPKVPPPPPMPQRTMESEEDVMRRARNRAGFRRTILTGALAPTGGGSTVLGGD